MAAGKYNVKADQGSTFVLDFIVSTDNVPWNLTGYTARMQVRAFTSSPDTILDLSTDSEIVLTSGGRVTVTVSAAVMSDVVAGKHYYDIELVSAGNEVTRILEGRFVVAAEVSR
jgi:hypothetical protein